MKNLFAFFLLLTFVSASNIVLSQESNLYKTKEVAQAYKNKTRSIDGNPGSAYWNNTIDYKIVASFNPESLIVEGDGIIHYHNNSPDTLRSIVFMLKQNLYKEGAMRDFPVSNGNVTEGVKIEAIIIGEDSVNVDNPRKVNQLGSLCSIRLDSANTIFPGTVKEVKVNWKLKMPENYEIRSGKVGDSSVFVGYWFPQVVVYDDVFGWDDAFYTGIQETYNENSNFDVTIKLPANYFMWATGDLQNPQEIYMPGILKRINKSKKSDEVVNIITEDDLTKGGLLKDADFLEWNFKADNVPDFAFAVSGNYVWDAASATTDKKNNRKTWVNVVYDPSVEIYKNTINYAQQSVEFFSEEFPGVPFPFQKHTTFLTNAGGGMEFPMMAANGKSRRLGSLAELTAHEIAHSYFPFLVNCSEEKNGWIDEGIVTLLGLAFPEKAGMESTLTKTSFNVSWNTINDMPLILPTSYMNLYGTTHNIYMKASAAFKFMFDMFTEKGLDHPLKEFIIRWEHKHPTPYDYFYTMEDLFGENFDWYWNPWYFEFHAPDLTIESVKEKKDHIEVGISNPGNMPVPVALKVEFEDGETIDEYHSAYIWKESPELILLKINTQGKAVKEVILGKDDIPDSNKTDNQWMAEK